MNVSVGVHDLLGAAVPGSLYLAIITYLANRADCPGVERLGDLDATAAILVGVLLSYVIGTIAAPIANVFWSAVPLRAVRAVTRGVELSDRDARLEFRERNPSVGSLELLRLDPYTLLAGLRHHAHDAATHVDRLHATAEMLRGASFALGLGALVATCEVWASAYPWLGVIVALSTGVAAAAARIRSRRMYYWATLSIMEAAVWLPSVAPVGSLPEREGV